MERQVRIGTQYYLYAVKQTLLHADKPMTLFQVQQASGLRALHSVHNALLELVLAGDVIRHEAVIKAKDTFTINPELKKKEVIQ